MNNRNTQAAARSQTAETFVVDLTSVCLRSGTVRLPLSLIGRFSEGQHKVMAGGEELMIEFEGPRTLLGLTPFFERAGLKANDRVQFVFSGQNLQLEAQTRERPRPKRSSDSPLTAGLGVVGDSAAAHQAAARASSRITERGLFPAPAELMDGTAQPGGQQAADSAGDNDTNAGRRGAEDNAIRRVRIEGGLPPRSDTVTPRPLDRASARDVWARRQQPSWRSLDPMIAGPVIPPDEAAEAFSESTVRVVRRSKGTSIPLEVEVPPLPKAPTEPPADPAQPVSYSMSWPLPEAPRQRPAARPADAPLSGSHTDPGGTQLEPAPTHEPAPNQEQGHQAGVEAQQVAARAQLDPYLDAPIDADREAHYTPPTILESDLLSIPSGGKWRTESEEAYLKYQEAQVAAAPEPVAVPAERRQGILGRLGLVRGSRGPADAGNQHPTQTRSQPPTPTPTSASRHQAPSAGAETSEPDRDAQGGGESAAAAPVARDAGPEVTDLSPTQADGEKRVIVDESVYDVDFDTEVQPQLAGTQAGGSSLESDMARLQGFLRQPDVPAIVRCDDLAERLQMSEERVSNAMVRLAEDRERFTPLRGDAYMVRRAR